MSAIQDYMLTVDRDAGSSARSIDLISQDLQSKQTSLIEVVQSLGEYINDEDATIRAKAVKLLGQLVASLPTQFLSRQQISVLCDFLCERVEDGHALTGLESLARLPRFTAEMAVSAFRALCVHYPDLKTRPQSRRYEALILLNTLLQLHRPALRNLELESLTGILDLVTGERDPRNLMVVFSLFLIVISEWDITSKVEEVYDAVFCYFPITFRPPPNDPYGITAQDLKQRLGSCLSASELFAPFLFPQLIDKLDSSAINAKRDVLRAIAQCAESYSSSAMSRYAGALWDSLKFEIFNAQEEELAEEAILSLTSLANCLAGTSSIHDTSSDLNTYLDPIAKECNDRLREPQQKQAQAAAKIVGALASTSTPALICLVQSCLPPLLTLYQDAETFETRRAILSAMLVLLQAAGKPKFHSLGASSPLSLFRESLSDLLLQALMHRGSAEMSFRSIAMENMTCLCSCLGVVDVSEVNRYGGHLCEMIIEDDASSTEFKKLAIDSISTLSGSSPDLITTVVLPRMFSQLPDAPTLKEPPYRLLNALASLKLDTDLAGTLVRRLLNKASPLFQGSGASEYFCAIIATVNSILSIHKPTSKDLVVFCKEKITSLTTALIVTEAQQETSAELLVPKVAMMIGRFTSIVIRFSNAEMQTLISKDILNLLDRDMGSEREISTSKDHTGNITAILRTYILAGCKASTSLPYTQDELLELLDKVVAHSQASLPPLVRQNLLQQAALLVNKFMSPSTLKQVEERLWANKGVLATDNLSRPSIRVGFWIVKALLLRLANATENLSNLVKLLSNQQFGKEVALAFELILSPDDVISKENGATIRLIAPQKIFSFYLAEAAQYLASSGADEKSNYLTALAGLLRYLGSSLVMAEGESLLPLLSQALSLENPKVKEAAIQTLTVLVKGSAESLQSHAPSLVSRLLTSASNTTPEMIQVRHQALIALQQFAARINSTTLMPYRQAVLNGIRPCLDDPKRFVRKDAVDCRRAWMELDEPENDTG